MGEVGGLIFTPQIWISMDFGIASPNFLILSLKNLYPSWKTECAKLVCLFASSKFKLDVDLIFFAYWTEGYAFNRLARLGFRLFSDPLGSLISILFIWKHKAWAVLPFTTLFMNRLNKNLSLLFLFIWWDFFFLLKDSALILPRLCQWRSNPTDQTEQMCWSVWVFLPGMAH